jgi:2-polyprenyl-3-methyl-5-hydroxy-6-metoxy-1,4-benzoquinol methylase
MLVCRDYTFVKCNDCGLVYQNPQPVFSDLKHRYRQNYFEYELRNEANFFHLMKLGLEDIRFFELTADLNGGKKLLDVGCATGMLLDNLRERGWAVKGVELCRESAEYGMKTRGLDIFVGTLEEALLPDASFPVVHFSHLIEHVPDPKGFFAEVRRILLPGGHVVVVTPNIDSLQARVFRQRWRSAIADHLTLFSRKTLYRMLSEAGFQVLKTVTWGGLAKGSVPGPIKRPVDYLAKKLGFGDVVLMLARSTG